ncbi:MAG: ATP-binding cassette domain-containing protein [Actinomycetota bacterium]|nr:ATP-binding cassette domain-containing protein [Actinomycetota bacterium]
MAQHSEGIVVEGLVKRFGAKVALDGLDLRVTPGSLLGLLGPNGAGKTTTVRVLATLLAPDGGSARVAGFDVAAEPEAVRARLGLTGQFAAVDENLTGRENLVWFGRLRGLSKPDAGARADELLGTFDLADAAGQRVKSYSGGMRRKLDLAVSIVVEPEVLVLDEPTTGLDPRSRFALWDVVRGLQRRGVTILLTTQYLEEADQLADRIVVVDDGRVIAEGTAGELKDRVGGAGIDVVAAGAADLPAISQLLARVAETEPAVEEGTLRVSAPVADGVGALAALAAELRAEGIVVRDLGVHRPSLDDVFLALTGHTAEEPGDDPEVTAAPSGSGPTGSDAVVLP